MRINKKKLNATKLPRSIKRLFPEVTECYDSDKAVNVEVSKRDIHNSKPLDPTNCAMAKAFKRSTNVDAAVVGISSSYLIKGKTAIRFHTPASVRQEIIGFDRYGDFEEGSYYLAPHNPSGRLGSQKHSGKKAKGASHSPKRRLHKTAKVRVLPSGSEY